MRYLLLSLVVLAGLASAVQTGPNNEMSNRLGQPIAATVLVDLIGVLALLLVAPFFGLRADSFRGLGQAPWWSWIGGVLGAGYVLTMVYTTSKVGAGVFVAVTVTSATVASVALDHFGWLGVPQRSADLARLVGCALMIGGVVLVARR